MAQQRAKEEYKNTALAFFTEVAISQIFPLVRNIRGKGKKLFCDF